MPMTLRADGLQPPLHEQIAELQRKIQLLEGDKKAYYESSQLTIKKNKECVQRLREENKRLHKQLAETLAGDERVINDAFQNRQVEKAAMRNKTGKAAIQVMDHKVCDKIKRLNAMKHYTETRKRRLEELKLQHTQDEQKKQAVQEANEQESEEAMNLRILENRLEKTQLKCQEAEHVMKVYRKLKDHLQEESLTFQNQLDGLETEILRQKQELKELQTMSNDAQLAKEAAKAELQHQEEMLFRERREREQILAEYKRLAEERRAHAERVERRVQRAAMQGDDGGADTQRDNLGEVEEEKTITTFEEAFQRIKEATGVTDTQEVVQRFISQGDTQKHLELIKSENEKTLVRLKEEQERLQAEFQEMKYSGEAKLSRGQQMLEELAAHLQAEEKRRDEGKENVEKLTRILSNVRAGIEHLADKMQHVKIPRSHLPTVQLPPSSEEYVLDLLSISEQKLLQLMEELQGKDLAVVLKEMEEEEFHASIEGKLPASNMRIKLPEAQKQDLYDDDESDDDETDVITRSTLKQQSQQIIDSRTKRKTRTKKKKGKQ
ncbi:coiled-coil domain-containing protein 151 isoform X2 [Polypterus senegalus]|uniref:coiled-coil domain-containing protein 151 isoform X2 n=1 Tax=Polypterus senegalus TaxID=55291 RepID=UPI0019624B68|nr:coiled-coil domain-containing protein 151 isoform X2 [Polypterus senegalus]